jgi:large subunit ribosomal protein L6
VEDNAVTVTPRGKSKRARQQWGMSRTMCGRTPVTGVSEGVKKELEIHRCWLQGTDAGQRH